MILIAVTSFSYSFYNCLKLEKKFDLAFFLPKDSYMNRYRKARFEAFPTAGFEAGIFMGNVNYTSEMHNIQKMVQDLENSTDITTSVNSWVDPFRNYVFKLFKKGSLNIFFTVLEYNVWDFRYILRDVDTQRIQYFSYEIFIQSAWSQVSGQFYVRQGVGMRNSRSQHNCK